MGMYDYMSVDESYIATLEAVMDNKMNRLNAEFDKLMIEHKMNLIDIETKIIVECGNEDDLFELYAFEAEEVKEKGRGILGSLFAAIKAFFKKVKEILFGKAESENLPEEANVPDTSNVEDEAEKTSKGIKAFLNGNKKALAWIGGAAVGIGVGATVYKKKEALKDWFKNLGNKSKNIEDELTSLENDERVKNASPEDQNIIRKAANHLKKCGSDLLKAANNIKTNAIEKSSEKHQAKVNSGNSKLESLKQKASDIEKEIEEIKNNPPKVSKRNQKKLDKMKDVPEKLRTSAEKQKLMESDVETIIKAKERELAEIKKEIVKAESEVAKHASKIDNNNQKLNKNNSSNEDTEVNESVQDSIESFQVIFDMIESI